ncbi:MAG: carboxypeptidase-like regulatory domain-containing protein [Acidobacteriota bacterium]
MNTSDSRRSRSIFQLLIILLCLTSLYSQTNTAEIVGTVQDASGAVLPGTTVTATHKASGLTVERVTGDQGEFLLPTLPIGEHTVVVELPGFKRLVRQGIILRVGQRATLDLALELGDISENITVTSSVPIIQKANAEINDIIENERVVDLPLNGRTFLQLALLSEGVVKPPGGTRGAALQQAGALVNVGGQRAGHNIYMLDGVKVTDELFNNLVVSPSVDAIQEFKIQKSMYSAEFGGKASALINVVMKSGTNDFHGNLYEFHRNAALDAKNFFDQHDESTPPLVQNQFGGTFGGPFTIPGVYDGTNRSFFFLNYEGQRIRQAITKTFSVPTAALRSGDFRGQATIYDPLSTDPVTGERQPFPDNRIPADRLDPIALAFLEKVTLPNLPGSVQNLVAAPSQRTDQDQFNIRLDHLASASDSLYARLSIFNADSFQPFGTSQLNEDLLPGFGRGLSTRSRNVAFGYTHTFENRVVNEFRLGWLKVSGGQTSENRGVDFASASGLLGVTADPRDQGFPLISLAGEFSTMGDPSSFVFRDNQSFELFENILLDRGNHQIKFGAYWFHLNFNPSNPEAARGAFSFSPRFTSAEPTLSDGSAFADFLLGYPTSAQVGIGRGEEDARTNWFHVYIQDDWRVNSNLTVNVGLRYEINQHMKEIDNRLSAIDLSVPGGRFVIASDDQGNISSEADKLLGEIPIPWVTSAEAGWSRSLLRPSYKRFAPRLGLAWELPGHAGTVVRTGFGIFLNQWAYSVQQNLARNLPFFFLKQIDTSSDALLPPFRTENVLVEDVTGSVSGNNMDQNFRTEYTQTWTLSLQHLLTSTTLLDLQYMGSRTVGADNSTVRNIPLPGPGPIDSRRPLSELSGFKSIRWNGWSTYQSLTAKIERRFSNGLFFNTNYTWSKSIDDASAPGGTSFESNLPQEIENFDAEKGLSSFHHAHRMTGSFTYQLPFQFNDSPTWVRALAGGWKLTGIVTLQSGAPFTVNTTTDPANIGPGPAQRPNALRNPNLPSSQRTPDRWFDTDAFSLPAPHTFGDVGRNTVFAPGFKNFDFSLIKTTPLGERSNLEFRAEFFNILNFVNFDLPNRFAFTPNFGRIFSAGPSRQIQLALKLSF